MFNRLVNFMVLTLLSLHSVIGIGDDNNEDDSCHDSHSKHVSSSDKNSIGHKTPRQIQALNMAKNTNRAYVEEDTKDPWTYLSSPAHRYRFYYSQSRNDKPWEAIETEIQNDAHQDISINNRERREFSRFLAVMHVEYPKERRIKYAKDLTRRGHTELGNAILEWQEAQDSPPTLDNQSSLKTRTN